MLHILVIHKNIVNGNWKVVFNFCLIILNFEAQYDVSLFQTIMESGSNLLSTKVWNAAAICKFKSKLKLKTSFCLLIDKKVSCFIFSRVTFLLDISVSKSFKSLIRYISRLVAIFKKLIRFAHWLLALVTQDSYKTVKNAFTLTVESV